NGVFFFQIIIAPELPVCRRSKLHLKDVTINNGIHWHGLALVNPVTPSLEVPLNLHIKANLTKYCGQHKRNRPRMITHRPRYVASYGMKGLKRGLFDNDDILLFSKLISELPTNERFRQIVRREIVRCDTSVHGGCGHSFPFMMM